MHKTTVYLPDDLRHAVRRMAAASARPEAEIIREAIAAHTAHAGRPRPKGGLIASGDTTLSEDTEDALAGFGER